MKTMPVFVGVNPGGRGNFAVSAILYQGSLPAMVVTSRAYSSVQQVLNDILGVIGEWDHLGAAAIDAPLTWSAEESGWRGCDQKLREHLPPWASKTWLRSPNALPGAVAVQGPALTWAMAYEAKRGTLGSHPVYESHAIASLAKLVSDRREAVMEYSKRSVPAAQRRAHLETLTQFFEDAGIVRCDPGRPTSAEELNALVCALAALGHSHPESGLVTVSFEGAEIRPVGRRELILLAGLP